MFRVTVFIMYITAGQSFDFRKYIYVGSIYSRDIKYSNGGSALLSSPPYCPTLPPVCLPSATYCQQDKAEGVAVSENGDYRYGYLTR